MKLFQYQFEWDPAKASLNLKKHKISFDRAATVFLDAEMLTSFDEDHSETEERWVTMGIDGLGSLLVVCHTFQRELADSAVVRIISARKAGKSETVCYRERLT